MTNPGHGPFEVRFKKNAEDFLSGLTPRHYGQVMTAVRGLMDDPYPDEQAKIPLPFPFPYGSIGFRASGFFITYEFADATTIRVLNITRDNPDYWG